MLSVCPNWMDVPGFWYKAPALALLLLGCIAAVMSLTVLLTKSDTPSTQMEKSEHNCLIAQTCLSGLMAVCGVVMFMDSSRNRYNETVGLLSTLVCLALLIVSCIRFSTIRLKNRTVSSATQSSLNISITVFALVSMMMSMMYGIASYGVDTCGAT